MIHVIEVREHELHPPLIAADFANRLLHEAEVRRKTPGAFLGYPFAVPRELVENNARHD